MAVPGELIREAGLKPSTFDYVRAQSLDEVFGVLSERGDDAKILAGGQSLIPAMNMRVAAPEVLIDVSGIADLQGITVVDGVLRIGAMSRHVEVLNSPVVAEHAPLIAAAMPHIAHATIRNRGTFGGSLCHADPAAELPACTVALDARFNVRSASGPRSIAAADFFEGTYTTCLEEDEILQSVDVPLAGTASRSFFDEVARRRGDYAMAGLAAWAVLGDQRIADVRLVYFAVGDKPMSSPSAAQLLRGVAIGDVDADAVCAAIAEDIDPFDDLTTSAETKLRIMQVLTRRALGAFASERETS